jgi:circadian clock protein KaiC
VTTVQTERVATHVDGLDELMGGGIPKGHVTMISGLPGTMKSSLAFSILHRNAAEGAPVGLYVTLEQTKASLARQMAGMGFEEPDARVGIVDGASIRKGLKTDVPKVWRDFLHRAFEIRRGVQEIDLLVLDSLEALEVLARFDNPRADLFGLFEWLRSLDLTSFILTEAPQETLLFPGEGTHHLDASYLADGVIHLKMHPVSDVAVQRRLRVIKMRGTAHETGYLALVFEDGTFGVTRAMSV